MKNVIVVGATSGIGRELALEFARDGCLVGVAGRRQDLLDELTRQYPACRFSRRLDVAQPDEAMVRLESLIGEMGGVDIVVVNAGVGYLNPDLGWDTERETIAVNVQGFTAVANVAVRHFLARGRGHLVGISSIAALRGNDSSPSYNASKAFVSNYLQGLRKKMHRLGVPVAITDIQPGFVATPLARGERLFWVATPQEAARQIHSAIRRGKRHAYVTKRWRLVAWLIKALPEPLYHRI